MDSSDEECSVLDLAQLRATLNSESEPRCRVETPVPYSGSFVEGLPQTRGWSSSDAQESDYTMSDEAAELFQHARDDWNGNAEEMNDVIDRMEELLADGATTVPRCRQLFSRLKRERHEKVETHITAVGRLVQYRHNWMMRQLTEHWRKTKNLEIARQRSAVAIQTAARARRARVMVSARARLVREVWPDALVMFGGVMIDGWIVAVLQMWVARHAECKAQGAEDERLKEERAVEDAARSLKEDQLLREQQHQVAATTLQAAARARAATIRTTQIRTALRRTEALRMLGEQLVNTCCAGVVRTIRRGQAGATLQAVIRAVPERSRHLRRGVMRDLCTIRERWSRQTRMIAALASIRHKIAARRQSRMQMMGSLRHFCSAADEACCRDALGEMKERYSTAAKLMQAQSSLLAPAMSLQISRNVGRSDQLVIGPTSPVRAKVQPKPSCDDS